MRTLPVAFSYRLDQPIVLSIRSLQGWQPTGTRRVERPDPDIAKPSARTHHRRVVTMRHHGRALPMELRVTPWSGSLDTHVELIPLRRLRPNRRYFRSGRMLLADAVDRIQAHEPAADGTPGYLAESA